MALGVPTLRSALRRAQRLGATVANVHRTGEIKVHYQDTHLTINARRKDATRELTELVAQLEAEANSRQLGVKPNGADQQLAVLNIDVDAKPQTKRVTTISDRIRQHIALEIQADEEGWRAWNANEIAKTLGVPPANVSVWAAQNSKLKVADAKRLELKYGYHGKRRIITHIRFAQEPDLEAATQPEPTPTQVVAKAMLEFGKQAEAAPFADVAPDEPMAELPKPPTQLHEPLGVLPTPKLAEYAAASKAAQGNRLLVVNLSDTDRAEMLSEALRLYYWVRAGGGR